ncbi:PadR family transcriptional regulator [Candidatus Micrarchaeota archaeon]|nr:PadR family transcriptional regulator [Candidatus Micrarchaeota archaeon]
MNRLEVLSTKPIKRLKHLLTSGNLWLYILSLVKLNGKIHAYALDDAIEKEFLFKPNKIMVYVVLYKLEGEGLISSAFEQRRKYYQLTEKGEETLNSAKEYFKILSDKL